MGGLTQPPPLAAEHESNRRPMLVAAAVVAVVVATLVLISGNRAPTGNIPHPYSPNLKLSDLKMSAAENFVGASVTYLDGTVTNAGDKTVIHAMVRIIFKDEVGQVVGDESIPLRVLQTSGPYPDAVDLKMSPLGPGQSKPFRLIFESISAQWNHQYPQIQVTGVSLK